MNGASRKSFLYAVTAAACLFFSGCSSAPKRAMVVNDVSSKANERYETANGELVAGQYDKAASHLTQAYNLALSVDSASLLCKICLSGIVYKIDIMELEARKNPQESTFLNASTDTILFNARTFAARSSSSDLLTKICSIYEIKLQLAKKGTDYDSYLNILEAIRGDIPKESYYLGYLYRTRADIQILKKDFASAEQSYIAAAEIHTKNRYLMEIGLDWYSVARCRSLAGNKEGAAQAIQQALKYDRDAENTSAIALDYYAFACILLKGEPSEKDRADARAACLWAAEIYESAEFFAEAQECRAFAAEILK